MTQFADHLLAWFHQHGRHDLPWQQNTSAYRVWLSEIMLQQTQVTTVIPYYQRFMGRFNSVEELAAAGTDEVLHLWTGLGYYARARNLHKCAKKIVAEFGGVFPTTVDQLEQLPGIGKSTAGAIVAISENKRAVILDGNVKRVLCRYFEVQGHPSKAATAKALWHHADVHTPATRAADYTQAIMDLGATVCRRSKPLCGACPIHEDCRAFANGTMAQYPNSKPKKNKPTKASRLFLLVNAGNACLLEKRPASGIWGGLWTPPERSSDATATSVLNEFGLKARGKAAYQPIFRHTFTHFHLDIEAVQVPVETGSQIQDSARLVWYQPGQNAPIGLSAPAVKLLNQLQTQEFELA